MGAVEHWREPAGPSLTLTPVYGSERGAGLQLVSGGEYSSGGRKGKSKNKLETHGLSWTEQEHRRFLEGLERFGACVY